MTERYIRVPISSVVRAEVWDLCEGKCHYCGKVLHPFRDFHVDHVHPVCAGGRTTLENLVGACRQCNERKLSSDRRIAGTKVNQEFSYVDSAKLRTARERAGMTIEQLAKRTGFGVSYIESLESGWHGRKNPHWRIDQLAWKCGVERADLVRDGTSREERGDG